VHGVWGQVEERTALEAKMKNEEKLKKPYACCSRDLLAASGFVCAHKCYAFRRIYDAFLQEFFMLF
jgi:hypothetical protein